ncbi:MAG: hypothetical protein FWG89_02965 [Treponema sp.]|nr:hypothetical protein [Treponema sp.]
MNKLSGIMPILVAFLLFAACDSGGGSSVPDPYIITGGPTAYNVIRGSQLIGEADLTLANALIAIRIHAAGAACTIQFGDGSEAMNIGPAAAVFNNSGDGTWGAITLRGSITGTYNAELIGIIHITAGENISITSTADITNTNTSDTPNRGRALSNSGTGTVTIRGGTVHSEAGYTVSNFQAGVINISGGTVSSGYRAALNNGEGELRISGGTVETTSDFTVVNNGAGPVNVTGGTVSSGSSTGLLNNSTGTIEISGGTVQAVGGRAVYNLNQGNIIVRGTALLTAGGTAANQGTIHIANGSDIVLQMIGGTVRNTNEGGGNAIFNNSSGAINITGGTVSKAGTSGYAVRNDGIGTVTIGSGATIVGATQL